MSAAASRRIPDAFLGAGRGGVRPLAAAAQPGRVRRPGGDQGAALDLPRGGPGARRAVRPRAAGRPARARQDVARRHHRHRDGLVAAGDVGPGGRPQGRHGRDPDGARGRRRALHRRDPPAEPRDRGAALPGDGGLLHRHRDRPGPGRALDPARAEAVHAGRRDHAHRPSHDAAARPLRHHPPARLLRPAEIGRIVQRSAAPARRAHRRRAAATRSRAARGARPGWPTGSCAGCATSPRCATRARSPTRSPSRRSSSSRSTRAGLERMDRAILLAIAERFSGGPVGLSTLAVAIGEEPDTLEDVYEPYLLQLGLLQRTPRGRVVTPAGYAHLGLPAPGPRPAPVLAAPCCNRRRCSDFVRPMRVPARGSRWCRALRSPWRRPRPSASPRSSGRRRGRRSGCRRPACA